MFLNICIFLHHIRNITTLEFKTDNERRISLIYQQKVEWRLPSNQQRNLADSDKKQYFPH